MNRYLACGTILLALLLLAVPARAQQDQTAVIGLGFGIHTFAQQDDIRKYQEQVLLISPSAAGMLELYGEWYPMQRLGFGLRFLTLGYEEKAIFLGGVTFTSTVSIDSTLLTVTFVPFISGDGYVRFGILGGAGGSKYNYKESLELAPVKFEGSWDTSGTAVLGGAYLDWGGEAFGARFGVHVLRTDFDPLLIQGQPPLNVDGDGSAWYFDLRWAFD